MTRKTKPVRGRRNPENYEFIKVGELEQKLKSMGREFGGSYPDDFRALVYVPTMQVLEVSRDLTKLHETLHELTD